MRPTNELIESLLWEEEGATLDFKEDQYPFAGANPDEKSELLKDVLAFANAYRRSDAFILIGVRDVKGGRSEVVGIKTHLDDARLQQFVTSKVQRPVEFTYRPAEHDGLPIGIIRISQQKRPIYATGDYGRVKKEVVYLRRGSSTGIATPDEIAHMGADTFTQRANEPLLELSLFSRRTGEMLGTQIELKTQLLNIPPNSAIPDYSEGNPMLAFGSLIGTNVHYYRELANFTRMVRFVRPVSVALKNSSDVTAHDVRLVFEVADPEHRHLFLETADLPEVPRQKYDPLRLAISRVPHRSDIDIERIGGKWCVTGSFGKIQPQETVKLVSDLYVGSKESGELGVEAQVFADNISKPQPIRLCFRFEVEERTVNIPEIEQMEQERFMDSPEYRALRADLGDGTQE